MVMDTGKVLEYFPINTYDPVHLFKSDIFWFTFSVNIINGFDLFQTFWSESFL